MSALVIRFSAVAISTKDITFFDFFQQPFQGYPFIYRIADIEFLFRMHPMIKLKNDWISFSAMKTWMVFQVRKNCQLYQSPIFTIGDLCSLNACCSVCIVMPFRSKCLILTTSIWHYCFLEFLPITPEPAGHAYLMGAFCGRDHTAHTCP